MLYQMMRFSVLGSHVTVSPAGVGSPDRQPVYCRRHESTGEFRHDGPVTVATLGTGRWGNSLGWDGWQ